MALPGRLNRVLAFLTGSQPVVEEPPGEHQRTASAERSVAGGPHEPPQADGPLSTGHSFPRRLGAVPGFDPDKPSITVARGGSTVRVRIPKGKGAPRKVAKRGQVHQFSFRSRRRMLALVNAVDQPSVKLDDLYFITLTYQQQDQAADASKRDLEKFLKRFERKYGPTWLLWKLEPQKRGTPHYHLLVHLMGRELEELQEFVAVEWWEIAGRGNQNHLLFHCGMLGNRPCVERCWSWNGVACYAGKYIGKKTSGDEEWQHPGRYWGERHKHLAPMNFRTENVSDREAVLLRRMICRHLEHQAPPRYYAKGVRGAGIDLPGFSIPAGRQFEINKQRGVVAVAKAVQEFSLLIGRKLRPQPWRSRFSQGGLSAFIPSATFDRYVALARKEAAGSPNVMQSCLALPSNQRRVYLSDLKRGHVQDVPRGTS